MSDRMQYKGYVGSVDYSDQDGIFYGKVENIRSLISYEGPDRESLRSSFYEAVEDYLGWCQKSDRASETPFPAKTISSSSPSS